MTGVDAHPIGDDDWAVVVRNVPVVSVDLIVLHGDGIVLGKRTNEPAKGEWFVPGGAVFKHEPLEEAVHRIAETELGTEVSIERQLGVYEHFYETAEVDEADGKHYVAIAYVVMPVGDGLTPDQQHTALRTFHTPLKADEFHPYVAQYLRDIGAAEPPD